MISLENLKILAQTQKLPKTVGDLSKLIVAKGFKKLPKVKKSLNLVTLTRTHRFNRRQQMLLNKDSFPLARFTLKASSF